MDIGGLFLILLAFGGICFVFGVIYPVFMAFVWLFKYRKVQPLKEFLNQI